MTKKDTRAWEREIKHAEMMRKQRKGQRTKQIRFAGGKTYEVPIKGQENEK